MLQGRLGLFLHQPRRRRQADPRQRAAGDAGRDRRVAGRGAADRAAGRHLLGGAALFAVRPDRQHARLHRLLAADLLHRPAADPGLLDPARLAAVRLSRRHRRDRLGTGGGRDQAVDHAGDGAGPVPGRELDALRALRDARRDPPRLRHHGAQQGPARARGDHEARRAQRADPGRDAGRADDAAGLRRRHRHRADLPRAGHRLAADRRRSCATTRR